LPKPITPASAETVINTAPRGSGLINGGGLTVDAQGRPHGLVVFHVPGSPPSLEHIWLQGGDWRREQLSGLDLEGRPQLAGTPDGRVWLLGVHGETLEAIDITPDRDRLSAREIAEVPAGWEVNYDSQALARFGLVEMLIPERAQPRVIVAPLD
jgi:hypothetical protein